MSFWKKALVCILAVEILGNASGLITFFSIKDWYASLARPPGTPPNGAFGPVWTLLYAMIGYALALIWHSDTDLTKKKPAFQWFAIQMAFNLAWTPAFFGLHRIDLALIVILFLMSSIAVTIAKFALISRLAAGLLVPYLLWVAYATYLNAGFWWLNR
ncbi:MAG: TspO/MBR family protein [Verrucomicrobiota bacterium]